MSLLALIFSFIAISNASPEACTTIDFRDRVGPIKNQLDTPWCFAFSAADLASFASGENISPYPIALGYHGQVHKRTNDCGETFSDGGYMGDAFDLSNIGGFCTEDQVQSIDRYLSKNKSAIRELYKVQENLVRFREIMLRDCQDFPGSVSYALAQDSANKNSHLFSGILTNMFPTTNIYDIVDVLVHPSLFDFPQEALTILANKDCKIKVPYKSKSQFISDKDKGKIGQTLDKILENQEIASLGIILNPFFSKENYIKYAQTFNTHEYFQQKLCEANSLKDNELLAHAVTLVGRTYNQQTKTCEYIIKNSWGTDCNEKSSIIPKLKCKDGYLFLTKNEIAQMIKSITVLEKKN